MSSNGADPDLSVVVLTDTFETIRKVVGHLGAQEGAERVELVVVHPDGEPLEVDARDAAGLGALRLLPVRALHPQRLARSAGVRAARAPLVVFAETHCYPQPGWVEGIIAAHRREVAAVGPSVGNANPESAIAWANLLIDYGAWLEADEAGPRDDLPGHNSSYKRELLLAYGDELDELIESEFMLHADLRRRGHVLWLEPAVRVRHLNVTRRRSWFRERFWGGRQFAAIRTREWPLRRRLVFAAGAPLIPVVRGVRLVPVWRRARVPAKVAPALAIALVLSGAGELVGSLAGPGKAPQELFEIELHREAHTR